VAGKGGAGAGGGIGFGYGHVGWVPLAPYETFHRWWGPGYYGRGVHQNVNITNVNVTNVYRNARVRNGISGVGYNDFQSGRFNSISRFSGDQVGSAGMIRGQMPLGPSRQHLQYTDRAASFVPRESRNATFYSRERSAQAQRIPFEQQRQAFSGAGRETGRTLAQAPTGGGNTRPPGADTQGRGFRQAGQASGAAAPSA